MTAHYVLIPIMLIAGGLAATQSAINSQLSRMIGSPIQASFISFLVGTLALLVILLFVRDGVPSFSRVVHIPPMYLLGGLCGVAFITTVIFLVPLIGVVNVLFVGLAGQMIMSVLIDHYGWLGIAPHPLNFLRFFGLLLILAGIGFLQYGKS
ncbi:MAG: DMT family transporter [Granulosicoccus sp.]